MHLDWGDSPRTLTLIMSVGEKAVYLCLPQLNLKIPLYSGQFLAIASRVLSHFVYYIEDEHGVDARRVVIVGFCDALVIDHAP